MPTISNQDRKDNTMEILKLQLDYDPLIRLLLFCLNIGASVGLFILGMSIGERFGSKLPTTIQHMLIGVCVLIALSPTPMFSKYFNSTNLSHLDSTISVSDNLVTIENDKFYYNLRAASSLPDSSRDLGDKFIGRYEYDSTYDTGYLIDKYGIKYELSRTDNEYINKKVRGDI